MAQTQQALSADVHHRRVSTVECHRFIEEIRTALLGVRAGVRGDRDHRAAQIHKDVQSLKNKAPETIGTLVADALDGQSDPWNISRVAQVIASFVSSRTRKLRLNIDQLNVAETREEGEFNNAQMAVAQGDRSLPALLRWKSEVADYRIVLDEIDAALDVEICKRQGLLS
jgi:hypothetical protein